jgi:carbon-monoxide dehydrogenase medium subunit
VILTDFAYERPSTVDGAVALLSRPDAVVLAGGQSLLPALRAGTRGAGTVVDIGRIPGLSTIVAEDGRLRIGALVRHHDLATSPLVRDTVPLLARAAAEIADPQVRHRGTIGGSLAYAAPAADLPTALLALDATVVLAGPTGTRETNVGEPVTRGELVTEIRVPQGFHAWSYRKFHRDALDWALVAVAAVRTGPDRTVRVALANVADRAVRASTVEGAVASGAPVAEAARHATEGATLPPDHRASDEYRRHLARVLTARALTELGLE